MEEGIAVSDKDGLSIEEIIKKRREELREEKERQVNRLISRLETLEDIYRAKGRITPKDEKIREIEIAVGIDVYFIDEEISLGLNRLREILVYRMMGKELCPAAEFGLCIGGLKDLITKEKCRFCQGHGTAEWDNY